VQIILKSETITHVFSSIRTNWTFSNNNTCIFISREHPNVQASNRAYIEIDGLKSKSDHHMTREFNIFTDQIKVAHINSFP
jgi:hypothetical protein